MWINHGIFESEKAIIPLKKNDSDAFMFITFEGGDGSGKSTQIQKLYDYLVQQGRNVLLTREPGGLAMCERVRDVLFEHAWSPIPEALLFSASRYELCTRVIAPALKGGAVVLCDRFLDSTRVYQGAVLGVPEAFLEMIFKHAVPVKPDRTLIFDIDPVVAQKRLSTRKETNHMDDRALSFHQNVRTSFLKIAHAEPERCRIIDAAQEEDYVFNDVLRNI